MPSRKKRDLDLPRTDDGKMYAHDCCREPEVWKFTDGSRQCVHCGKDWTEKKGNWKADG